MEFLSQCKSGKFCLGFFYVKKKKKSFSFSDFVCFNDIVFGDGLANDEAIGPCEVNEVGERTAVCRTNGTWEVIRENCILQQIHDLLMQSEVTRSSYLKTWTLAVGQ